MLKTNQHVLPEPIGLKTMSTGFIELLLNLIGFKSFCFASKNEIRFTARILRILQIHC